MDRSRGLVLLVLVGVGAVLAWLALRDTSLEHSEEREPVATPGHEAPSTLPPRPRVTNPEEAGRLAGAVTTTGGESVARARVCAHPRTPGVARDHRALPSCSPTGSDGRFAIEGLRPGRYAVMASASGHRPAQWADDDGRGTLWLAPGESRSDLRLVLRDGAVRVAGHVRDGAGGVVDGALVLASTGRASAPWASARTDAEGAFELDVDPGRVVLRATADGYAPGRVTANAPTSGLEIVLLPASTLTGHVRWEDGTGVANATVTGLSGLLGDQLAARTWTDASGRFAIDGLAPGRYHLSARARGGYGVAPTVVDLGFVESREDLVITLAEVPTVEGTVVVAGATEQPCPAGHVRLRDDLAPRTEIAAIDAEGRVRFPAVVPGTYAVRVHCEGFRAKPEYPALEVGTDAPARQRWEVDAGAGLTGTVESTSGERLEGATVRVVAEGGDPRTRPTPAAASTDADGSFELDGLATGPVRIEAGAPGYGPPTQEHRLELTESEVHDVHVVLTSGGAIDGEVVQASGAPLTEVTVRAQHSTIAAGRGTTRTDEAGHFSLEGLPPGDTRVLAYDRADRPLRAPGTTDDDRQGVSVEVVEGRRVTTRIVVENRDGTIRGSVTDADGGAVADAFVTAQRESDSAGAASGSAARRALWGRGTLPELTDEDGAFALEGLAPGRYTVRAFRRGGGEARAQGVAVGAEITLTIADTAIVSGTVMLADGSAADDFTVVLLDRNQGRWRRDAFFHTGGAWQTEVEPGEYDVRVSATQGTARRQIGLRAGEHRRGVDFVLAPRVTVTGRVVTMDELTPLSGMQTSVRPVGGSLAGQPKPSSPRAITDAEGRFELVDVQTGRVYVLATPVDPKGRKYTFGRAVVELVGPGPVDIGDVLVPPRRLAAGQTPGDLGFTLAELVPGAAPEDVHWIVAAVRPDGPAADSGLTAGDQIMSVDGFPVDGVHAYVYHSVARVPAGSDLTLGVARGLEVTVTAAP